jgi:hypothetical protein
VRVRKTASADAPGLIDLEHYSAQAGTAFADTRAAYAHFLAEGEAAGLTPSPFFFTEWYRWQNTDCARYETSLAHFADAARHRPIDPAPFLDMVLFLRQNSRYASAFDALLALVEDRDPSLSPSLQDHFDTLAANQDRVHAAIRSRMIGAPSKKRRRLVWVQSGPAFRLAQWFKPAAARRWDLMCNWYTLRCMDIRFGEMHLRQSGTKATAIHHALAHHGDVFSRYDQVLFLDDDLGLTHDSIDHVFDLAEAHNFDMFQPAVAHGSQCVWPDLFQKPGRDAHETTAVEIMMPGFSRRALELCAPVFGRSVSGFGLDFACSEKVRAAGWRCGVIDAVAAEHIDVIDEKGGAYYEFMRALGINQKLELYQTIRDIGKLPEFRAVDIPR